MAANGPMVPEVKTQHSSPGGGRRGQAADSGLAKQQAAEKHMEELRRRRREEEVGKARMILEIVGEKERRELEEIFPELLTSPTKSQRSNFFLDDPDDEILPKAFIFMGPELVETQLGGSDTEIDFGLTGCRISMRGFVGLRPIQRFSKMPALPANFVRGKDHTPLETATKLATNVGESLKGTWQWLADKKPFGFQLPTPGRILPAPHAVVVLPADGVQDISHYEAAAIDASARGVEIQLPCSRGQNGAGAVKAESEQVGELDRDPYSHMGKWEIVWKDHSVLSVPVRRLEFGCNAAGLSLIREKLAMWQQLATSAGAMLEASQAAMKANGGMIPENPGIWLPSGIPASAQNYLNQLREGSEKSLPEEGAQNGHVGYRAEPADEQVSISDAPEAENEEVARSPSEGGMSSAEMAAAGVKEGDNIIRWGSVCVAGKYLPKRTGDSLILSPGHFMALAIALPVRLRTANWTLLYSTARDGISLATLYRKVASRRGPCVLIVRDSQRYVFGSFTSEEWKPMTKYYGNGECFVFQVQPLIQAFRWTHANSYFMYSTPNSLALGGGSHYAFFLNADLLSGYSAPCETFGSTVLAGSEEFEAVCVEAWGLR